MAKRRTIDDSLAELEGLADPASPAATTLLRSVIERGSSLLVARAAEIIRVNELREYRESLARAFDRFLGEDPGASDPQCRAKTAIVESLGALEYHDSAFFLKHLGYRQFEPVWGGSVDTAAPLRGLCGYGLVQSDARDPLLSLIDLLADPEKVARQSAAQSLALTGRDEAALILRTKLRCGDEAAEVVGECLAAYLSLAPVAAIPFVATFLDSEDQGVRFEAVAALGGCNRSEATAVLIERCRSEPEGPFRESLLLAIGATRRSEAVEYLLSLVGAGSIRLAAQALTALAPCRFSVEIRQRVGEVVDRRGDRSLQNQFAKEFAAL